jgi:hypothetical protein
MHNMLHIIKPGAILVAVVFLSALVISMIRGLQIPQCFYCGAVKVRPARPSGFWETVAMLLLIRPYRCLGCRARFHAMRFSSD